jgi:hypothetical protein
MLVKKYSVKKANLYNNLAEEQHDTIGNYLLILVQTEWDKTISRRNSLKDSRLITIKKSFKIVFKWIISFIYVGQRTADMVSDLQLHYKPIKQI